MRVERLRTLAGPNVYSDRPIIVMVVVHDAAHERLGDDADSVLARVDEMLPSLRRDASRWDDRTLLLHPAMAVSELVAAVAAELLRLAEIPARSIRLLDADAPDCSALAVEFAAERATLHLLEVAVALVDEAREGRSVAVDEAVAEARRIAAATELGPSTRAIAEAADRRGIPWMRVGDGSLLQLGYGARRRFVQAAMTDGTSCVGADVAGNKQLTKLLLEGASIPVPRGVVVADEAGARAALAELGAPVVVKPLDGHQGKGVTVRIETAEQAARAFAMASHYSKSVIVEEQLEGSDFRVLVVGGRFVAASERTPAHVLGDGTSTVAELLEAANRDPRRGEGHEKPLTKLRADEETIACLEAQGLTLASVPPADSIVYLCGSANLSKGGVARDVTDVVHPSVARMCERAARLVGLDVCGVDLVAEAIDRPLGPRAGIVELNAAPGLRMHCHPSEGTPRDVAGAIVDMVYPEGAQSRIPIVSITGTNGKTTTTRMVGHVLSRTGLVVGVTTTDGIWIGGEQVAAGDTTGPASARTVLTDPTVEAAVLETARGGIVRRGLGYDWSDVGVITNIQTDHIGQDGITCVDDLLAIKRLVAERVREGGTIVLNADDERLARLPRTSSALRRRRIVYFSLHEASIVMKGHLSRGGVGYFRRADGWIVEAAGSSQRRVARADAVPATLGGAAEYNVANVLAAVAACRALGLEPAAIAEALADFGAESNSGRTNLYRLGEGYVMVDYGHNPGAHEALARLAANWSDRPTTCVLTVPGDRWNSVAEEIGTIVAGSFGRIVITEDEDLRGREPGEMPAVLEAAIRAAAPTKRCEVIRDQREAVRRALDAMGPGEVVVVIYDRLGPVHELLEQYGARPAASIDRTVASPRLSA